MKTTIFWFTGTGNSLKVARDLHEELEECELVPIAKVWCEEEPTATTEKVGFVFPLYYYGLPKIVYDFINEINLDTAKYIFAIITRAGSENGNTLIQLEKILRKKSKMLRACMILLFNFVGTLFIRIFI